MGVKGTVTNYIPLGSEHTPDIEFSPRYWRAFPTLPIVEFFENWKEKFRSVEWIPTPDNVCVPGATREEDLKVLLFFQKIPKLEYHLFDRLIADGLFRNLGKFIGTVDGLMSFEERSAGIGW